MNVSPESLELALTGITAVFLVMLALYLLMLLLRQVAGIGQDSSDHMPAVTTEKSPDSKERLLRVAALVAATTVYAANRGDGRALSEQSETEGVEAVRRFRVRVNGETFDVEVEEIGQKDFGPNPDVGGGESERAPRRSREPNGAADKVLQTRSTGRTEQGTEKKAKAPEGERAVVVRAPLRGEVMAVAVREGQQVDAGDLLLTLEALKLENEIVAPTAGVVRSLLVEEGDEVEAGQELLYIEGVE